MTRHDSSRNDARAENRKLSKAPQGWWRRSLERIGRALETIAVYDVDGIETITLPDRRRTLDGLTEGEEDGNASKNGRGWSGVFPHAGGERDSAKL